MDLISPVQMPVEFQTLFFIIRASTANQGKRKHMSFFSSVFIWQLIKAIFFLSIVIFLDIDVTVFQFTFQP